MNMLVSNRRLYSCSTGVRSTALVPVLQKKHFYLNLGIKKNKQVMKEHRTDFELHQSSRSSVHFIFKKNLLQ